MLQHDMSHKKIILSLSPLYDFVETKTKNTYIPPQKKIIERKKKNRKCYIKSRIYIKRN